MSLFVAVCPCGKSTFSMDTVDRRVPAKELEADNWRNVAGAWRCFECLGLPMPPPLRAAIDHRDAIERGEDPDADESDNGEWTPPRT